MFRRTIVRRILALVVLCGLGMFMGESLIADECAEHSMQTSAVIQGGVEAHSAPHAPHNDGHQVHACHCAHAHATDLPTVNLSETFVAAPPRVASAVVSRPLSITLEPQLRPPLA